MYNVIIDKDKCNGCGECVDICPVDVFELVNEKSEPANMDECVGCESCVESCPEGAISVAEI